MSTESKKVVQFCKENGICTRCKCKPAATGTVLCVKCTAYVLNARDSSFAKLLLLQHGA